MEYDMSLFMYQRIRNIQKFPTNRAKTPIITTDLDTEPFKDCFIISNVFNYAINNTIMKRLIDCNYCNNQITTKQVKGQIIYCNSCQKRFVENEKEVKK